MRNLKKILALVLALMMTLSLMVTANASEYTDADKVSEDYEVAVEVLSGMGIFQGDNKGQFLPDTTLNRKDASVLVYRVLSGDVDDERLGNYAGYAAEQFSDVSASAWYEPYVAYAALNGYIQGYAGKFNPDAPLTGVELLTILLRAVGYDVNGEFSIDWVNTVTKQAAAAGIDVPGVVLNAPVTREVTAEIIFQVIEEVNTVVYTPSLGYYTAEIVGSGLSTTLGKKIFELKGPTPTTDTWGRPGCEYTYNTGDEVTSFAYEALATYTTKVDECDIADDLGLKKKADIVSAYIDGEAYKTTDKAVTTNRYATIDPLATTSLVGAQGRLTEVYAVSGGYRIVEINTYLAQVESVTATKTDKNGHETPGYSTLKIYTNATTNTGNNTNVGILSTTSDTSTENSVTAYSTSTSFAKGDYVLVTANETTMDKKTSAGNKGLVATIELATPAASGALKGWTSTTTTIGGVTVPYNNADKFELNNPGKLGTVYDVYVDANGNVIGLAESAKNYLVVETIEWVKTGYKAGSVMADVVLSNGTRYEGVTISTINNGYTPVYQDQAGQFGNHSVSDTYQANSSYYNHIYTYSVNADGTYNIIARGETGDVDVSSTSTGVNISTGLTSMDSATSSYVNSLVVDDATVFLVKDKVGSDYAYTYTTYVGKNNVPNMANAQICYLTVGTRAALVVVTQYQSAADIFVAYVPSLTSNGATSTVGNDTVYGFTVYELGSTATRNVWYDQQTLDSSWVSSNNVNYTGLYKITVTNGVVTNMKRLVADNISSTLIPGNTYGTYTYGRVVATSDYANNVVNTSVRDLYLDDVIATLAIDQRTGTVSTTSKESIENGETLLIAYTTDSNGYIHPAYVYVVRNSDPDDVNEPTTSAVNKLKSVTVDDANVVIAGAYNTLAEALNNAVAITRSSSSAQDYDVKVTTKGVNADGTGIQCYGNMALYGSKEAAKSFTAANNNIFYDGVNAITYSNVAPGSYLVINTNNNGVIAYYAYYFA